MWRTPQGEQAIVGAEARLLQELLGYVYDEIDFFCSAEHEPYESGVRLFDSLQPAQQLALLATVGTALLDGTVPPPKLTAVREATIAVLFAALRAGIDMEIDTGDLGATGSWRDLLLRAYAEGGNVDEDLPYPECEDLERWEGLVEAIKSRLLWDADWDMEDLFADSSPEASRELKRRLGIADDYFTDVAPDPNSHELADIRTRLNALTGAAH